MKGVGYMGTIGRKSPPSNEITNEVECEDSSVVRFSRIDPMVSSLSPTSAKLSFRVRRVTSSL